MGGGNFRPPQNPHPLTDHQKLLQVIVGSPCGANSSMGWLLYKRVKYEEFLKIYYYLLSRTHLQVRPVDGFSSLIAQTMQTRVCFEGVSLTLLPILGVKPFPTKPYLGRVNKRFQAKRAKCESQIIKPSLLHRF